MFDGVGNCDVAVDVIADRRGLALTENLRIEHSFSTQDLPTHDRLAVLDQPFLGYPVGEYVRRLVGGSDGPDCDQIVFDMLTEIVVLHIDVLRPWSNLVRRRHLQSAAVVFEDPAVC